MRRKIDTKDQGKGGRGRRDAKLYLFSSFFSCCMVRGRGKGRRGMYGRGGMRGMYGRK